MMMEYEREYLCWKKRQLALQMKYADTPPGLSAAQAKEEESRQQREWRAYEERGRLRLATGVRFPEEPFAGRREELLRIRRLFEERGAGAVFLSGMGGIGKSALARAYGRAYAEKYDQILMWSYDKGIGRIFADDGQLGFSDLVYTKDKYRSRRGYAREKYRKLTELVASERVLIILDNYNRMKDPWLDKLLAVPCDLLVTTRLSAAVLAGRGYAALAVEALASAQDWQEFYRIYADRDLGVRERETLEEYRKSVLGHTLKMKLALCNPKRQLSAEKTAKSILANFRLKRGEIQIMCELSFITLHGIPEEVYLSCTEEEKGSLEALKCYSLVQERTDSAGRIFLSLHPVVDEAVRGAWKPDENRCLLFLQSFTYYIRHSWNRPREGDMWLTPQVFAFLERLPEPAAERFFLYECLAAYLMEWEYFGEAEQIELKLYKCVREYYGEEHQYTAQLAMRVASVYYNQMRFEESRGWYEQGYRLYKDAQPVDGKYWADRAEACEKIARIYEYGKDYETALRYTEEAMEAARAFLGESERVGMEIWMDKRMRIQYVYLRRARLYFAMGDVEAAKRDLEEALRMFPLNPFQQIEFRTLQIRIDLLEGAYRQAQDAAALNLEVSVYYQGESYKDSLSCRELLGDVLIAVGEIREANTEYVRVLSCLQEKYPYQKAWIERMRRKLGGKLI